VVAQGADDRVGRRLGFGGPVGALVPGMQQAAGGPDARSVAGATALGAIEDISGGIAAEHGDQAVVHISGACR
jgi:hypothetical protein